jgi:hypothetical protein
MSNEIWYRKLRKAILANFCIADKKTLSCNNQMEETSHDARIVLTGLACEKMGLYMGCEYLGIKDPKDVEGYLGMYANRNKRLAVKVNLVVNYLKLMP